MVKELQICENLLLLVKSTKAQCCENLEKLRVIDRFIKSSSNLECFKIVQFQYFGQYSFRVLMYDFLGHILQQFCPKWRVTVEKYDFGFDKYALILTFLLLNNKTHVKN